MEKVRKFERYIEKTNHEINKNSLFLVKIEIKCQREGFVADPTDKQKYGKCLRLPSGQLVLYKFTCNNETIWDQINLRCLKPKKMIETSLSESEEGNKCNMCVEL